MKTKFSSKSLILACGLSACGLLFSGPANADLLNIILSKPISFFDGNGHVDFSGGTLSVTGTLINTDFGSGPQPDTGTVAINILLDSSGVPSSGASANDFVMTGTAGSFSGTLLTGKIQQFGFLNISDTQDFFDFRFTVTGGTMASLFAGKDIGVTLAMETDPAHDFSGSFTSDFSGGAKGFVGPTPPICTGEIGDYVWKDLNSNGLQEPPNNPSSSTGEPGINGVTVVLTFPDLSTQSTVTGPNPNSPLNNGFYLFTGLCAGTYKVEVPSGQPALSGLTATIVNAAPQPANNAIDSNPNPATVVLSTNSSSDRTIDFGFVLGVSECPTDGTGSPPGTAGTLICTGDGITTDVHCIYRQSTLLNDNSYGTNAVGWGETAGGLPGSHSGHTFSNLTGSDRAEFVVKAADGTVVADFTMDYISLGKSLVRPGGTISGYDSLGPFGGDHACAVGCTTSVIKDWNTTLAHDLNDHGFCSAPSSCTFSGVNLLVNSPPTVSNSSYDLPPGSPFGAWDFVDGYEFTIAASAFAGHGGFVFSPTAVTIPFIHNSPAKNGPNIVVPGPCPEGGGECKITAGSLQRKSKTVTTSLTNSGTATITLSDITLSFPAANGNLLQVKLGGDTVFSSGTGLSSPAHLTSANLTSTASKKSIGVGVTRVLSFVFKNNAVAGDYSGTIKFGDGEGCSVDLTASGGQSCPTQGPLNPTVDPVTGDVTLIYNQPRTLNDNSYGVNAIGWGTSGHKFSDLVGSDHIEFIFKNGNGQVVMDFGLDYISTKSGTPSGYASLGPFGGDGFFTSGNPLDLLSWNTSLARNLNDNGFCSAPGSCTFNGVNLLVNSPPADANYNVSDPAFDPWNFTDSYEMKISHLAFGPSGFGSVSIGVVHNSPAKKCPTP